MHTCMYQRLRARVAECTGLSGHTSYSRHCSGDHVACTFISSLRKISVVAATTAPPTSEVACSRWNPASLHERATPVCARTISMTAASSAVGTCVGSDLCSGRSLLVPADTDINVHGGCSAATRSQGSCAVCGWKEGYITAEPVAAGRLGTERNPAGRTAQPLAHLRARTHCRYMCTHAYAHTVRPCTAKTRTCAARPAAGQGACLCCRCQIQILLLTAQPRSLSQTTTSQVAGRY